MERVLELIEGKLNSLDLPTDNIKRNEIKTPIELFIGYLIFDFWIANLDRHHENWGIILEQNIFRFAPTYDHAAGLGSKVSKDEAKKRLNSNDENYKVKKFVTKAKSPFYNNEGQQLKTIEVVEALVKKYQEITCYWIDKISTLERKQFKEILDAVPDTFMDEVLKVFVLEMLDENKKRLVPFTLSKPKFNEMSLP